MNIYFMYHIINFIYFVFVKFAGIYLGYITI